MGVSQDDKRFAIELLSEAINVRIASLKNSEVFKEVKDNLYKEAKETVLEVYGITDLYQKQQEAWKLSDQLATQVSQAQNQAQDLTRRLLKEIDKDPSSYYGDVRSAVRTQLDNKIRAQANLALEKSEDPTLRKLAEMQGALTVIEAKLRFQTSSVQLRQVMIALAEEYGVDLPI